MPKYRVILTRDITESTVVEVDAENPAAAYDASYDALYDAENVVWEIDDGSWGQNSPYVTDVDEV
jgi:hypothetical protein